MRVGRVRGPDVGPIVDAAAAGVAELAPLPSRLAAGPDARSITALRELLMYSTTSRVLSGALMGKRSGSGLVSAARDRPARLGSSGFSYAAWGDKLEHAVKGDDKRLPLRRGRGGRGATESTGLDVGQVRAGRAPSWCSRGVPGRGDAAQLVQVTCA